MEGKENIFTEFPDQNTIGASSNNAELEICRIITATTTVNTYTTCIMSTQSGINQQQLVLSQQQVNQLPSTTSENAINNKGLVKKLEKQSNKKSSSILLGDHMSQLLHKKNKKSNNTANNKTGTGHILSAKNRN